jgi:hypothetical protein
MCKKCDALDRKIIHYKDMAVRITDQQTLDGIASLIDELISEKLAIRCDIDKK